MLPISDLDTLLSTLEPQLQHGTYVYVLSNEAPDFNDVRVVAAIRETEGLSLNSRRIIRTGEMPRYIL